MISCDTFEEAVELASRMAARTGIRRYVFRRATDGRWAVTLPVTIPVGIPVVRLSKRR